MKTLNTYIIEKLKIRKSDNTVKPISKKELPKFIDYLYTCLETKEPSSNKEDYIAVYFTDSHFFETSNNYYINIDNLENHTDENSIMTIFYNLAKCVDSKYTGAGIMMWDPTSNEYSEFAHATLKGKNRMWHPEYITINNHPFI